MGEQATTLEGMGGAEFLATVIQNIPAAVYLKDLEGRYLFINKEVERLFGLSADEVLGKTDSDFFPPEQVEVFRSHDQQVLAGMRMITVEETVMVRGENRVYGAVKFPVFSQTGKLIAMGGVSFDITEQVEAVERFRALFEAAPDPICLTDPTGRILACNPATREKLGLEKGQVVGRAMAEFLAPEYHEAFAQALNQLLDSRRVRLELEMLTSQGERKVMDCAGGVVYGRAGEISSFVFIHRDVTDQYILDRERACLEQQLFQAQKLGALGILAGGVAHDFNNILQAALGYAHLLEEADEDLRGEYLKELAGVLERGKDLVQRLLLFSRRVESKVEAVDLNEVVQQALKIVERTIPKTISLEQSYPAHPLVVLGDRSQLEQVLMNLVTNAVDAMGDRGRLWVATRKAEVSAQQAARMGLGPGEYAVIEVEDTGVGIDKEVLEHMFEPFFTTKPPGKGTGLGLSTAYGIIRAHKGGIACSSRPGQGTCFQVYLPLVSCEQRALGLESRSPLSVGSAAEARGSILVVEDEKAILQTLVQVLERRGYSVVGVASAEEALEVYASRSQEIDLVLLDLGIPRVGGLKCLEEIKRINPEAKVVITTGYGMDKQAQARQMGAEALLPKPYRMEELLALVGRIVGR